MVDAEKPLSSSETELKENNEKSVLEDPSEAIEWEKGGEEEDDDRIELAVVGKIWTDRNINKNAFIATIKGVWQPKHGVDISNMRKNRFLFQFYHWKDKHRILEEQPWHFDRHAQILREVTDSGKPSDIELSYLPMWTRIYNLPLKGRLNVANVEKIGNKIGVFVRMDDAATMGIDKSIRLPVMVGVRKPLCRHVRLKLRGGIEEVFEVKYEKSPLFCFYCKMIGHGLKDCDDYRESEKQTLLYGSYLKTSPWKVNFGGHKEEHDGDQRPSTTNYVKKPRRLKFPEDKDPKQVSEVVLKLGNVELQNTETEELTMSPENNEPFVFVS